MRASGQVLHGMEPNTFGKGQLLSAGATFLASNCCDIGSETNERLVVLSGREREISKIDVAARNNDSNFLGPPPRGLPQYCCQGNLAGGFND